MSKSGTGHNVEDMLSSVRRLVSDELPRMPRADVPKGPAALVLTEKQRIAPPLMGHNSRRKSLEDRIAELEAAVADSAEEYEPDGSEDLEQHRPDRIVFKAARPTSRPPVTPLQLKDAPAKAVPAKDDAAKTLPEVAEDAAEFAPEMPAPLVLGRANKAAPVVEDDLEDTVVETVSASVAEMAETALNVDGAFDAALAEAVSPEPAEPEEPDAGDEAAAKDVQKADADDGVSLIDDITPEDIDELRHLIASMIRDELQGDLGEHITRNVRKLVRQEIQRALTVREIE